MDFGVWIYILSYIAIIDGNLLIISFFLHFFYDLETYFLSLFTQILQNLELLFSNVLFFIHIFQLAFFLFSFPTWNFFSDINFLYPCFYVNRPLIFWSKIFLWYLFSVARFLIWESPKRFCWSIVMGLAMATLLTGLPGLHDNAASADACRWSVVMNAIWIHVKWTIFEKL